jgi:hypothetical protein
VITLQNGVGFAAQGPMSPASLVVDTRDAERL